MRGSEGERQSRCAQPERGSEWSESLHHHHDSLHGLGYRDGIGFAAEGRPTLAPLAGWLPALHSAHLINPLGLAIPAQVMTLHTAIVSAAAEARCVVVRDGLSLADLVPCSRARRTCCTRSRGPASTKSTIQQAHQVHHARPLPTHYPLPLACLKALSRDHLAGVFPCSSGQANDARYRPQVPYQEPIAQD